MTKKAKKKEMTVEKQLNVKKKWMAGNELTTKPEIFAEE